MFAVNHAPNEWRCHLSTYVDAEGGHFEHRYYQNDNVLVTALNIVSVIDVSVFIALR